MNTISIPYTPAAREFFRRASGPQIFVTGPKRRSCVTLLSPVAGNSSTPTVAKSTMPIAVPANNCQQGGAVLCKPPQKLAVATVVVQQHGQQLAAAQLNTFRVDSTNQMFRLNLVAFRIKVILEIIRSLELDPMCIPRGQKRRVMRECLKYPKTFTAATFAAAWKEASKGRQLSAENRDEYTKGRTKRSSS